MKVEIILDILILVILGLSSLICIAILITIFISFRPFHSNVRILLTFNIYSTLFFASIMMFIIYFYNLYGDLNPLVSMNDRWCELRAYLVNVSFCTLYYSCVLKSIFRLFRVVFSRSKYFQSYLFFIYAIPFQWFLSFILILLNLFNNDYEYLPQQYRCWISFENTRGLLLAAAIIYFVPLTTVILIYTYIVRHVLQINRTQQRLDRNVLVFKRIVIFVLVIVIIGLPTTSILMIWMISGKLIPLAYHIQGLSMSIGIFIAAICFALISPQIREIFRQNELWAYLFINDERQLLNSHATTNRKVNVR